MIARVLPSRTARKRKFYRGPRAGTVVVWTDGKFVVRAGDGRSFQRMPAGLAQRVNEALDKGRTDG